MSQASHGKSPQNLGNRVQGYQIWEEESEQTKPCPGLPMHAGAGLPPDGDSGEQCRGREAGGGGAGRATSPAEQRGRGAGGGGGGSRTRGALFILSLHQSAFLCPDLWLFLNFL